MSANWLTTSSVTKLWGEEEVKMAGVSTSAKRATEETVG